MLRFGRTFSDIQSVSKGVEMHRSADVKIVYVLDSQLGPATKECEIESRVLEGTAKVSLLRVKDEEEFLPYTSDAEGIILGHDVKLTRKSLSQLRRARLIVRKGVGVDNVDIIAAREWGIPVCNVPDYGTEEVADHALAMALSLWRRLGPLKESVRAGNWNWRVAQDVRRTRGRIFGVVGCGRIGTATARRAQAFGFDCIFEDPYVAPGDEKALGIKRVETLNELLEIADIVSLHVPLTEETFHLLGRDQFQHFKPAAYLVNTSRGPTVDERALVAALQSGKLAGAALDVVETEPLPPPELLTLENCIVTPHAAFYSVESLTELREKCARLVLDALTGKKIRNIVNEP
jgi:phosphoglycerate dehydrogenase-like enzyme